MRKEWLGAAHIWKCEIVQPPQAVMAALNDVFMIPTIIKALHCAEQSVKVMDHTMF